MAKTKSRPVAFLVPKEETGEGRYHEVAWAKDGNLNASHRRGHVRKFRSWFLGKKFARAKAKELGSNTELVLHPR